MDEEKKTTPAEQPQPPAPLSDARKAALLRYMAILFAVAFLLVLLSLILQTHSSKSTISELSAASTSALDNAVKLQEQNRALQEEKQQLEYLTNVVQGVQAKREELEGYITKYSVGWSLSRIARMAVAIMEVCMYEALYIDDAPISAAINEAVELTRKYENEDVVSFVNGILGGFAREVQQLC